jgi:hypothetical protein
MSDSNPSELASETMARDTELEPAVEEPRFRQMSEPMLSGLCFASFLLIGVQAAPDTFFGGFQVTCAWQG